MRRNYSRSLPVLIAAAFFTAALLVRLIHIDYTSLWLDEILQVERTSPPATLASIWRDSPADKPPLDYWLQSFFLRGARSETRARLHACLLGAGGVVALGATAWTMAGARAAILAMALATFWPLHVRFSQEARPYALMLLAECLFLAAAWRVMKAQKSPRRDWVMLSLATALALWSLYYLLPSVAGVLLLVIISKIWQSRSQAGGAPTTRVKRGIFPALSVALSLASIIPLIPRMQRASEQKFDGAGFGWKIGEYLDIYALGYEYTQNIHGLGICLAALIGAGFVGGLLTRRAWPATLCLALFLGNFFGVFLYYRHIGHWIMVRYTLAALPPAVLLCAMAIDSAGEILQREWRISARYASATICAGLVFVFGAYALGNPFRRPQWREAASHIAAATRARSVAPTIVLGDYLDRIALDHYLRREHLQPAYLETNFQPAQLQQFLAAPGPKWVVNRPGPHPAPYWSIVEKQPAASEPFWELDVRRVDDLRR